MRAPTTHVIDIGELQIICRLRLLRPWTWVIRVRGATLARGVGGDALVTNGWNVIESLDSDGLTEEAGHLRTLLLAMEVQSGEGDKGTIPERSPEEGGT